MKPRAMLVMDKLVSDLRKYAAQEHGKRAAIHWEISSQVFAHASELADELERMQKRLDSRDSFLVSRGLFQEYADQLPR